MVSTTLLGIAFVVIFGLASVLAAAGEQPYARLEARLAVMLRRSRNSNALSDIRADTMPANEESSPAEAEKRARSKQRLLRLISDRLAGKGFGNVLATRLRRADLRLQVAEFVLITVILAALGVVLGWLLDRTFLSFVLAGVGFLAPSIYLNRRLLQRRRAIEGQLADALGLISNSLRSGYSFLQAMDVVAKEMPPPISREFEQVLRETRVNIPVEPALESLVGRVRSDDLDLAITSILIQRQVGGNLSEVLDNITNTVRERARIAAEVRTLTASGRLSGWVVSAVPAALVVLISALNPGFMRPLFTHPIGWAALGAAVVMQAMGAFFISRIMNVKF
jgi:tight adherence protein B